MGTGLPFSSLMKRAFLLPLVLVSLAAQDSRFEARSRLVQVPVTVTDAKGHTVDGLETSDFLLFDNGRAQKAIVDTLATGVAPISLVIAVQSSGIANAVLDKVRKIGGLIRPLITGDRGCAALVSFAERVTWLQRCTKDPDAIESEFHKLEPGEPRSARMIDAVNAAVEHLANQPDSQRVLLLISETRDRGSETELAAAVISAQSAGVTVYAATYSAFKTEFTSKTPSGLPGLRDPITPVPNPEQTRDGGNSNIINPKMQSAQNSLDVRTVIGELARLHKTDTTQILTGGTGGTKLPFTRQKGLEEAIEKLGAELHTRYVISFVPDRPAAGYHRIEVRAGRTGEFHIRARSGYWSTEKPE
jgi:VWFA-related protein